MSALRLLIPWCLGPAFPWLGRAEAALPGVEGVEQAPAPAWVTPIEPDLSIPPPASQARASHQYLLVDDQVRVTGAAGDTAGSAARSADTRVERFQTRVERFHHGVYRIVTQEALEDLSRLEIVYVPQYETVRLHHLRVWREGTWEDRLQAAQMASIQQETALWQHMFDGSETLLVVLPDIQVGDVVSYAYTLEGLNPVFDGHYTDFRYMGWALPAATRFLQVRRPVDEPLHLRALGGAPPPAVSVQDDVRTWTWRLSPTPAVVEEYDVPADLFVWPQVQLSDFGTWGEVQEWAEPLYAAAHTPGPAVREQAERITAGLTDDRSRALACIRWVQDQVRYFGIEMGVRSHAPHDPQEVLKQRFGDCKDKSLLLCALLEALGIEAHPVLVSRTFLGGVAALHPSPTAFDHVIVRVRVGEDRFWLDPTESGQGGDLDSLWIPSFDRGLVVGGKTPGLVAVPPPPHPQGRARTVHRYHVPEDGTAVRLEVISTYRGRRAELARAWLADITEDELYQQIRSRYGSFQVNLLPLGTVQVDDDRETNRLRLVERYRLEGAWVEDPAGRPAFSPLPLDIVDALALPDRPDRRWPLALPEGLFEQERIEVLSSTPWTTEPPEQNVDTPWFSFEVQGESQPGRFTVTYALDVHADRVPPQGMARYQRAVQAMGATAGLTLARGDAPPAEPEVAASGQGTARLLLVALVAAIVGFAAGLGFAARFLLPSRRRRAGTG